MKPCSLPGFYKIPAIYGPLRMHVCVQVYRCPFPDKAGNLCTKAVFMAPRVTSAIWSPNRVPRPSTLEGRERSATALLRSVTPKRHDFCERGTISPLVFSKQQLEAAQMRTRTREQVDI